MSHDDPRDGYEPHPIHSAEVFVLLLDLHIDQLQVVGVDGETHEELVEPL